LNPAQRTVPEDVAERAHRIADRLTQSAHACPKLTDRLAARNEAGITPSGR
jgi:hypothetical protein